MKRLLISLILMLFIGLLPGKMYAQECTVLAENEYCIDGTLCRAEAPFPIWSGFLAKAITLLTESSEIQNPKPGSGYIFHQNQRRH